ncbi:nuclear membrane protein [Histoplasma capsulatum var. duboisii H88]|uniref:Nuclear membrane protein n=1 Tax=Ajellomyces capsulatus (strain H88) TaxID=544711 RepID=F0ULA1_AJEC8|nr:nuclear membrane protein [Histoplasma capsulatum var. duboisii H88]QSS56018.1 nuclear membrane protein [Histoplasma capsulatum var. duboisii H88]
MDRRIHETPMDFEWQNRASGETKSPFYQLALEHQNRNKDKKRPYSIFDSPAKSSTPALREPSSQSFLFSQPPAKSSTIPRNSPFMTPRQKADIDFSSDPENISSPENADNDETPEKIGKADRRNSLFNFFGRFAPSPGRGEIPKTKYSNVLVTRVHKKRRRDREINRKRQKTREDSDSDERTCSANVETAPQNGPQGSQGLEFAFFSRLFTFLESHPHIPRILSYYAQFIFNLVLTFLTLYIIVTFLLAIQADVDRESEKVSADILADMAVCAKNYMENRCGGEDGRRLPALEAICENWERCMNRDPAKVGRAKVSAQTLAEIFNGFIEPISFKTMFFFVASIASCFAVSNLTFSLFRNKSNNPPSPMSHPYMPYPSQPIHQQQSHIPYSSQHPSFGHGHYHDPTFSRLFSQDVNINHRKTSKMQDDWQPRQLALHSASETGEGDHPKTPSPVKRERTYT